MAGRRTKSHATDLPLLPKRVLKEGVIQYSNQSILHLRWRSAQQRASRKKLPFELTVAGLHDLLKKQDFKCHYSGIYLSDFSIDRVDPAKGYTWDNVVLAHIDVNFMKQDYNVNYFLHMIREIQKHQEGKHVPY